MTAKERFRDAFTAWIPSEFASRPGLDVGYRFLWSVGAICDAGAEVLSQGIQAAWPGVGTPTALPLIAASRGITRGLADTTETFAAKLVDWVERRRVKGSARELARQIQEYLPGSPRVRVICRNGVWTTRNTDGSVVVEEAIWDWDSVSHPERANWWSNLFVVIYTDIYPVQGNYGDVGRVYGMNEGVGHKIPKSQLYELRSLMAEWKAGHSRIRAVIWTADNTQFDPTDTFSCPNGTWGSWSEPAIFGDPTSPRVRSARFTNCRYWEF